MSPRPLPRVFSLLSVEKDPAVDDALREALPHLDEAAREAALELICERGRPATLAELIVGCAAFEPSLQKAIFRRFDAFHPGLRTALESPRFEDRAAAIAAVLAAKDYKSAHSLADALRSHCTRTRELAADAIRTLTESHLARRDHGVSPAEAADFHLCARRLGEVLQNVVKNWEAHLHTGVLEAALWMIESVEEVLGEQLGRLPNRIAQPVNAILSRSNDSRLAPFVVRALSHAGLRAAAAAKISQARDPDFIAAIFDEIWLLSDPQIEHAFRSISQVPGFEQRIASNPSSDSIATAAAVRMFCCLGGPRDLSIARMSAIADQAAEPVRRAILWELVADESSLATQALCLIAARTNDPRSVIAARECQRRQSREGASPGPGVASPPTPVRKALDRFIEEHDRLSPEERASLSERLKSLGPELVNQLERKLESARSSDRTGTLRAIQTLGLVQALLPAIYRAARDPDSLVRSTALSALNQDNSPTALRLLRDALNDPDPRVQATAIEALEHLGIEKSAGPVHDKCGSRNNRVRANAIKALWNIESKNAAHALENMLKDASADHRLSALWVVERMRVRNIVEILTAMSGSDPDARIRARAIRVMNSLGIKKELV